MTSPLLRDKQTPLQRLWRHPKTSQAAGSNMKISRGCWALLQVVGVALSLPPPTRASQLPAIARNNTFAHKILQGYVLLATPSIPLIHLSPHTTAILATPHPYPIDSTPLTLLITLGTAYIDPATLSSVLRSTIFHLRQRLSSTPPLRRQPLERDDDPYTSHSSQNLKAFFEITRYPAGAQRQLTYEMVEWVLGALMEISERGVGISMMFLVEHELLGDVGRGRIEREKPRAAEVRGVGGS